MVSPAKQPVALFPVHVHGLDIGAGDAGEKDGYDAVFISCNLDIGLHEARQLVDIPVTATLESAALVAHMMGASYSLVTVDHQNGKIQEMLLNNYGLHEHFASQRPFDIDANDLYPDQPLPPRVRSSRLWWGPPARASRKTAPRW